MQRLPARPFLVRFDGWSAVRHKGIMFIDTNDCVDGVASALLRAYGRAIEIRHVTLSGTINILRHHLPKLRHVALATRKIAPLQACAWLGVRLLFKSDLEGALRAVQGDKSLRQRGRSICFVTWGRRIVVPTVMRSAKLPSPKARCLSGRPLHVGF
jgi:hypothetical protein